VSAPLDLRAVEARLKAATPGQWVMLDGWGPAEADGRHRCARIGTREVLVFSPSGPYGAHDIIGRKEDFEFTALAGSDIRALLAALRETRVALEPLADYALQTRKPRRDELVSVPIMWSHIQRAAAVLASVTDEGTP
jgi:hypothetical protein